MSTILARKTKRPADIDEKIDDMTISEEKYMVEDPEEDTDIVDESSIPVEIKINEWLQRSNIDNAVPKMYLYRIDDNNPSKRTVCGHFEGSEIPDEHTIGMINGSGHYQVALYLPPVNGKKRNGRTWTFRVDPIYDQYRREQAQNGLLTVVPSSGQPQYHNNQLQPSQELTGSAAMFKEAMSMVAEIMGKMIPQQSSAAVPDMSSVLMAQYKGMSEMMNENLMNTSSMMNNLLKKRMSEFDGGTGGQEDEDLSLFERFLPKVIEMLPMILANPATGNILKGIMRTVVNNGIAPKPKNTGVTAEQQQLLEEKKRRMEVLKFKMKEEAKKELLAEIIAKKKLKEAQNNETGETMEPDPEYVKTDGKL
jgi:hypothetical protein